jgi:hypothetical protein
VVATAAVLPPARIIKSLWDFRKTTLAEVSDGTVSSSD